MKIVYVDIFWNSKVLNASFWYQNRITRRNVVVYTQFVLLVQIGTWIENESKGQKQQFYWFIIATFFAERRDRSGEGTIFTVISRDRALCGADVLPSRRTTGVSTAPQGLPLNTNQNEQTLLLL